MPSFDILSEVDMQEVDNAVNVTKKVLATRYDFRGSKTEISLDKKGKNIHILTEDKMKVKAVQESLISNFIKRGVDVKFLKWGNTEPGPNANLKKDVTIRNGIEKEEAKKIVKLIKDTKLKVRPQIQDEQVRVTGKSIDDLQSVIQMLKGTNIDFPLQFVNMKS